jgi:Alpha-(1->3)-arabinofuranosyltransferase
MRWVPWLVGACAGIVAIGRGLAPGYLVRLDMVTVPRPPLTGTLIGVDSELPRAVPSDLVLALFSHLAPGGVAIKVLLVGAFAVGAAGVARLVPEVGVGAGTAAGVLYVWNPWTAERLAMGHWGLLMGYAGLPWVAATARELAGTGRERAGADRGRGGADGEPTETARELAGTGREPAGTGLGLAGVGRGSGRAGPGRAGALVLALVLPAVGGVSTCVLAGVLVVCVLARSPRALLTGVGATLLVALPWVLPTLLRRAATSVDPAGVDAFALRPDGPFGPVGTALQLAGSWNRLAVPAGRGLLVVQVATLVVAVLALVAAARTRRDGDLLAAGALGLVLAVLPTGGAGAALLRAAARAVPAAAVMRDSDRWLALLALPLAVGFAHATAQLATRAATRATRAATATTATTANAAGAVLVLAAVLPVALLPGLAGQLRAAHYPAGWERARSVVDADAEPGALLALPWTPFRRYGWSGSDLPTLTPATKFFGRQVRWNDDVIVGGVPIRGEDPGTPALTAIIDAGPTSQALRGQGIRYVLVENDQLPTPDLGRLDGTAVLRDGTLTLYRLDGPLSQPPAPVRAPALVVIGDLGVIGAVGWCSFRLLAGKLRARVRPSGG